MFKLQNRWNKKPITKFKHKTLPALFHVIIEAVTGTPEDINNKARFSYLYLAIIENMIDMEDSTDFLCKHQTYVLRYSLIEIWELRSSYNIQYSVHHINLLWPTELLQYLQLHWNWSQKTKTCSQYRLIREYWNELNGRLILRNGEEEQLVEMNLLNLCKGELIDIPTYDDLNLNKEDLLSGQRYL